MPFRFRTLPPFTFATSRRDSFTLPDYYRTTRLEQYGPYYRSSEPVQDLMVNRTLTFLPSSLIASSCRKPSIFVDERAPTLFASLYVLSPPCSLKLWLLLTSFQPDIFEDDEFGLDNVAGVKVNLEHANDKPVHDGTEHIDQHPQREKWHVWLWVCGSTPYWHCNVSWLGLYLTAAIFIYVSEVSWLSE